MCWEERAWCRAWYIDNLSALATHGRWNVFQSIVAETEAISGPQQTAHTEDQNVPIYCQSICINIVPPRFLLKSFLFVSRPYQSPRPTGDFPVCPIIVLSRQTMGTVNTASTSYSMLKRFCLAFLFSMIMPHIRNCMMKYLSLETNTYFPLLDAYSSILDIVTA